MQCERYSAGLTSRPASSSTTFAPASHNCFVMTPPAAPEPITHTSYFTAAIPGIILERDLARVKEPPAAYCPRLISESVYGFPSRLAGGRIDRGELSKFKTVEILCDPRDNDWPYDVLFVS